MRWFVLFDPFRDHFWGVCNTPLHGYENAMRWFVLSDPSRDHLWGVCNTPLPWYENTMRWFVLSDPSRDRLWGRMQYASTLPDEKRRSQNVFVILFETQNRVKMFLRCFLRLKIESKCFCDAFWGSKLSSNVFVVLFEDQNRVQMLLMCFLRLKIESKCFWGAFWDSKWSESVFEVYLLHKMEIKKRPGTFFWGVRPLSNRFDSYMRLKT